jgi:hypothetical protein
VGEAGVLGLDDRVTSDGRLVVIGSQMDRPGDGHWVAAVVVAELVEFGAASDAIGDVASGDVPGVRVPGRDSKGRGGSAGNQDRRVWPLHGLGITERAGELDVIAVEVERCGLRPETADDGARFVEALYGLGEREVRQAVGRVFAPRFRWVCSGANADPKVQPSVRDSVDGCGDFGQYRGRSDAVAGDQ